MIDELCSLDDTFSHLARLEDGKLKADAARAAIKVLRHQYEAHAGLVADERKAIEARAGLTEVVRRQRVFAPVVREYLKRIDYASDGWAARLISPATPRPIVVADPRRAFGQPIFISSASRVEDVVDRWKAGDPLVEVAEDFGVPTEDVEDILRAAVPVAA